MRKLILVFGLLCSVPWSVAQLAAQVAPQIVGAGAPANPCANGGQQYVDQTNHLIYACPSGGSNWALLGLGNLASNTVTTTGSGAPAGNCPSTSQVYVNTANGDFYDCPIPGSAWVKVSGAGGNLPSGTGVVRVDSSVGSAGELSGVVKTSGSNVTVYAIANTTFTVSNATFGANTCTKLDGTAGSSTVSMTGMATSSVISISPAADTATIVGFGTAGGLVIDAWPTSNTANIKVCNQTASGITTGATLTFNISAR